MSTSHGPRHESASAPGQLTSRTLGKYEVLKEVGRGAMGTVYLAHDPFAGREVAIKVAHQEALEDESQGARYRKLFFNEAQAASMLRHPNIISVFDANVEGDTWYIVMEYVPGGRDLHHFCKPDILLPMEDVVRIVFKCARALDYAHRKGVVHRDVKPRNILLTLDQDVKISDFSIALVTRVDQTATQIHGYVGSPLYMSPEQVREEEITNQTDVFSIGVVLYEMLTGRHPFIADKLPAISYNIAHRPHVPLRELRADAPRVLEHILDRTLAKSPASRYRSALDLAGDLSLVFDHMRLDEEDISGQQKFSLIRQLSFFREFADPEIWEIINAAAWLQYGPDSEIIVEGEVDDSFYVIVSGEVMVRKGARSVHELSQGDCFGEMGFIARQQRSASIVAKTDVSVIQVRASLIERASLNCQLRFHKIFLHTLIARLSRTTQQIGGGS